ncbi:FadR/GntR family transcriptional regulator [Demequina silvatica]|uniref:FadR/GntR family transcriptional regulator n=1 Tax=Demequina silvatica TaxID=1638988 RepID=UPI000785EE5F|nr:GntR family transcriptional regulator [Demequina silvatica]
MEHVGEKASAAELELTRIKPAYEQVAGQLRMLILNGSLAPGERLPVEGQLAGAFGVSRTTIREALRMLSSQDLVHTLRGVNGGTFVSRIDPSAFSEWVESRLGLLASSHAITPDELREARELIELPAVRMAAERRSEADLEAIILAAELERNAGASWDRGEHSQDFHLALLAATQNTLLLSVGTPIFRLVRKSALEYSGDAEARRALIDQEHLEIIERITLRDADGAAEAMTRHLVTMRGYSPSPAAGR